MIQFKSLRKTASKNTINRILFFALLFSVTGETFAVSSYPPEVYIKRLHRFHNRVQKSVVAEVDRRLFEHFCPEQQRQLELRGQAYFQIRPQASHMDLLAFKTVNMYELRKSCPNGPELTMMSKGLRKRLTVLKLTMINRIAALFSSPTLQNLPNSLKNIIAIRYWENEVKQTFDPDYIIGNANIMDDFSDPSAYEYLTVSTAMDPYIEPFLKLFKRQENQ